MTRDKQQQFNSALTTYMQVLETGEGCLYQVHIVSLFTLP